MTTTQLAPPVAPSIPALPPVAPPQETPQTRKFTVAEYYRLAETGILAPEERVQLIEGEIILMPPIGPGHSGKTIRFGRLFGGPDADQFMLQTQNPLHLDDGSEPEPDAMLLRPRADFYETSHPTPADTLLVIEVSDSTLDYDRNHKAHIYGRAGVVQTLVLNLPEDCIENFTEPGPQGYGRHTIHRRGDKIRLVALPDLELAVEDLLPAPPAEVADKGG